MKRGKLWWRGLGLGSLLLSVESFSLGHCGSASLGCLGYRFGSEVEKVYGQRTIAGAGEVLGRMQQKEAKGPQSASLRSVSFPCPCGQLRLLPLGRIRAQAPGPLLLGSGILEPHLQKRFVCKNELLALKDLIVLKLLFLIFNTFRSNCILLFLNI